MIAERPQEEDKESLSYGGQSYLRFNRPKDENDAYERPNPGLSKDSIGMHLSSSSAVASEKSQNSGGDIGLHLSGPASKSAVTNSMASQNTKCGSHSSGASVRSGAGQAWVGKTIGPIVLTFSVNTNAVVMQQILHCLVQLSSEISKV